MVNWIMIRIQESNGCIVTHIALVIGVTIIIIITFITSAKEGMFMDVSNVLEKDVILM